MTEVKVLVVGKHQTQDDKLVIGATISLIKSNKNIIVDPGHFADEAKLLQALTGEGLKPDNIDIVFLTHLHLDHIANTHLFKQAHIFCKLNSHYPGQYHIPDKGYVFRENIEDGLKLAKDVEFLLTPGHTDDHVSLLVKTPQGKVVIAGDALPSESMTDLSKKPFLFADLTKYDQSREKILKLADFIVPGHGPIFSNKK